MPIGCFDTSQANAVALTEPLHETVTRREGEAQTAYERVDPAARQREHPAGCELGELLSEELGRNASQGPLEIRARVPLGSRRELAQVRSHEPLRPCVPAPGDDLGEHAPERRPACAVPGGRTPHGREIDTRRAGGCIS